MGLCIWFTFDLFNLVAVRERMKGLIWETAVALTKFCDCFLNIIVVIVFTGNYPITKPNTMKLVLVLSPGSSTREFEELRRYIQVQVTIQAQPHRKVKTTDKVPLYF